MGKTERINVILSRWNPIDVPSEIANSEYKGYAEELSAFKGDKDSLQLLLEDIIVHRIGLDYQPENKDHKLEITKISSEILDVINNP